MTLLCSIRNLIKAVWTLELGPTFFESSNKKLHKNDLTWPPMTSEDGGFSTTKLGNFQKITH